MKTKVIFYYEKNSNDVFAFFPEDKYNEQRGLFTCYAHIGQHSACHIDHVQRRKMADVVSYRSLAKELEDIGYDLIVMNELEIEYHRNPTTAEIRFGEGATHYKSFPIAQAIKWTKYGYSFKKWLKCPADGLRYYY